MNYWEFPNFLIVGIIFPLPCTIVGCAKIAHTTLASGMSEFPTTHFRDIKTIFPTLGKW